MNDCFSIYRPQLLGDDGDEDQNPRNFKDMSPEDTIRSLLKRLNQPSNDRDRMTTHKGLGRKYIHVRKVEEAIRHCEKGIEIAAKLKDICAELELHMLKGIAMQEMAKNSSFS